MSRGASRLARGHATVRRRPACVVVHFSPSRTSRPAGCRVYGPGAVTDASPVTRHASNPRSPGRLPGGTRKVSGRMFYSSRARVHHARAPRERVRRGRRKRAPRYTEVNGPGAVTGPGPLLVVRFTFDRPANVRVVGSCPRRGPIPVGDATALGTLRTRLETRTKESNMYASHWD